MASLSSCLVLCEGATPDVTSTLVNCNELGSQLPHRSHISMSSCLKNPGERNDVLEPSIRFAKCVHRLPLEQPLQFCVIVAHRWRHLYYSLESFFLMSLAGIRLIWAN